MEPGNWKAEVALGALVVAALAGFLWLTFAVGGAAPQNANRYVLLLDSALGLTEDNAVAVAGVKIGIVDDIRVEGRRARVTVAIAPDVPLHADARAALRQRTLLGEKYVDLDPGAEPAPVLAPGAVLDDNVPTVEIDQVIRDVAVLVDRLNRITPPLESALAHVDHMLEGEGGKRLEDQLVATLTDVRALMRGASKLVEGSGDDVAAVVAMAREHGPGLATKLGSASSRLDEILAGIDPKKIEEAAARVAPAAENIDHITGDMRTAMADLRTAAKRLDGVLSRFDRTLGKLESVDEKTVREFFQVQGVRVNLIPDQAVTTRIKKLRDESVALPE